MALTCLLLTFLIVVSSADEYDYQLVNDLLQDYSSIPRPSNNNKLPTTVYMSLTLGQILDVDERNQVISVYGWLIIQWFDPKLSWDPKKYDNLSQIKLNTDIVWLPDLIISNSAEKLRLNEDKEYVMVENNGKITWLPNGVFRANCEIDVRYFPFDKQNCYFKFNSITHFATQINLETYNRSSLANFHNSTEWDVLEMTVKKHSSCCPVPLCDITFYLIIKRKPLFYVFNMILPCVITLAVAFLAFLVPFDSGEKMSISITSLLSIIVLLLVIANDLPPSSDYISLIGIFYGAATLCISSISLVTVLSLNIYHYGEHGMMVPLQIQKILFSRFGKIIIFPKKVNFDNLKFKVIKEHKRETDESNNSNKFPNTNETKKRNKHFNCFRITKVACEKFEVFDKDVVRMQWKVLADITDRLFFYLFLIAIIITLRQIINSAPN